MHANEIGRQNEYHDAALATAGGAEIPPGQAQIVPQQP
jgi:hypothetical protein